MQQKLELTLRGGIPEIDLLTIEDQRVRTSYNSYNRSQLIALAHAAGQVVQQMPYDMQEPNATLLSNLIQHPIAAPAAPSETSLARNASNDR